MGLCFLLPLVSMAFKPSYNSVVFCFTLVRPGYGAIRYGTCTMIGYISLLGVSFHGGQTGNACRTVLVSCLLRNGAILQCSDVSKLLFAFTISSLFVSLWCWH